MIGFFAAVMVGAVLSTFNSVLNSSATLFSEGIYASLINKKATGRQLVFFGRACSVVLALLAMIVAPMINSEGSLFNYLQKINATFFGPMLAVILLGLFTKNVTAKAAKVGIVVGPIIFALIVFVFQDPLQAFLKSTFDTQDDIHFLHFLALVFVITILVMLSVSRMSKSTHLPMVATTTETAPAVDVTPWKHAKVLGAFICFVTILSFVLLAQ